LTLVRPGIEYNPLPPMIPISACAKGLLGSSISTDKVVIIQKEVFQTVWDRVSDPAPHNQKLFGSRGNCTENLLLQIICRHLVQALGDHHGVALHINNDRPVFRQPGPLAGQMVQNLG